MFTFVHLLTLMLLITDDSCASIFVVVVFPTFLFVPHLCMPAPFFEIRHPSSTQYRSGVYERANKKDRHIDMNLTSPVAVSGDVMIEFFNKPRMMKKVPYTLTVFIQMCHSF